MTDRSRNIYIGLTFLSALAVAMGGIVFLGKFPVYGGLRQYSVILHTSDANGITSGSRVEFNGMYAGQVVSTWLSAGAQGHTVVNVLLAIDPAINIPESTTALLERPATVGNPFVVLKASELVPPFLSKAGDATLDASAGDSSLIPASLVDGLNRLTSNLNTVAGDLHTMLAYTPPEALEHVNPNDPNRPRANATTVILRLDSTIASLQTLLTDPKLQGNVRDTVQNVADASAHLKELLAKFDDSVAKFNGAMDNANTAISSIGGAATQASATFAVASKDVDRLTQQLAETLAQLDKSIKEVTDGPGTTGRLVSDPRLYESLNDLTKSLKSTSDDLDFLLNKWKDEGVNLKLK